MTNPYWHIPEGPGPHCQVCGGQWPDGHYANCPVKTGEAVQGFVSIQPQIDPAQAQKIQQVQNLLGASGLPAGYKQGQVSAWSEIDFVGGPLDGPNPVYPEQNYKLNVEGNTSGYYELLSDFKYHWIAAKAPSSDPSPKEVPSTRVGFLEALRRFWTRFL
jgi:hypothetical protein